MVRKKCSNGFHCTNKSYFHRGNFIHPGDEDWGRPLHMCRCGGGPTCIVDRRLRGDYIVEDRILLQAGCEVRLSCYEEFDQIRMKVLERSGILFEI